MQAMIERPLPRMQGLTREFYAWCARSQLRFQRCSSCSAWRHVPREMCARCGSFEWRWERSSGAGRVYTWTTVERPMHPAFAGGAPYAVVVVEMDEGVRLASTVTNCPPAQLRIGMPVRVVYDRVAPGIALPRFARAGLAQQRGPWGRTRE